MNYTKPINPYQPQQPQAQPQVDTGYAGILQRLESAQYINLAHAKTLFIYASGIALLISLMVSIKARVFDVILSFFLPILFGALVSGGYYTFSLRRWHKMITSIRTGDFNGNGIPDHKERTTLVIRLDEGKGNYKSIHTDISESDKADFLNVARAFVAGRPTSQTSMHKNHRIGRKKLEKIMQAFLDLNIIEKLGLKDNDPYTLKEDERSRAVMQALAYGQFETLRDVWPSPSPNGANR